MPRDRTEPLDRQGARVERNNAWPERWRVVYFGQGMDTETLHLSRRGALRVARRWVNSIAMPDCDHHWEYLERKPGEMYTGYCEQCVKCHAIQQIAQ